MSSNIENKVVEFEFNNANFEKNVSKSMSTLEKLKSALNFDGANKAFKDLDNATKNFDPSSMEKSIGGITDKFSALQTVAIGALIKIGEQAVVAGEKITKALTVDQVLAGFDKYTNKVQSVATMYATGKYTMEEIEGSLSNLNTYTDKTSYSFSTLVDNMSKFTSAGVELKEAEQAMEGIGNWAALSGITAASGKVNQMAYNLSQAVGSGALLLQDWKSIENVNAATEEFKQNLINTGLAMGTLQKEGERVVVTGTDIEVTTNNLRNTLQKRWVNDKVLLSVLGQYADETTELGKRAQIAAAEARTFEDAVGAVSDALSTSWMATHETLFGDYKEATLFFTGLQDYFLDIFDSMNTARNELLSGALSNDTSWNQLSEMFETLSGGERTFEEQMRSMAKRYGYSVDEMIQKYGSLKNAMEAGEVNGMTVAASFRTYGEEILKMAAASDVGADSMTDFERVVKKVVRGGYGQGIEAMRALTEEGWNYDEVMQEATRQMHDAELGLDNFSEAQLNSIGFTKDQVRGLLTLSDQAKISGTNMNDLVNLLSRKSGRELLIDSLYNSLDALRKIISVVKEAWNNIFPSLTAEKLYDLIVQFEKFTETLMINDETAEDLRKTFEGVFAILDIIGTLFKDVFITVLDLISDLFGEVDGSVLDFTGNLGENIVSIRDWIKENDPFLKALTFLKDVIEGVVGWIGNLIDKFLSLPIVQEVFAWLVEKATAVKDAFVEWAESTQPIQNGFEWISDKAEKAFTAIKNGIQTILEIPAVAELLQTLGETARTIFEAIVDFFNGTNAEDIDEYSQSLEGLNKINLGTFKEKVMDLIGKFAEKINTFLQSLKDLKTGAEPIFQTIGGWITTFCQSIETMWQTIKTFVGEHLGSITALILTGGLATAIILIAKALVNLTSALNGFGTMLAGIGSAFKGYGFKLRMEGISGLINALGNMFKNIAVMLAGMVLIANTTTTDELDYVMQILLKLITVVGVFMLANEALKYLTSTGSSIKNVGNKSLSVNVANGAINSIVQMALAVAILAQALKSLTQVDSIDSLYDAFNVLTFVIAEMTVVSVVLGKFGGKIHIGSISLVSFAAAVWVLADAIKRFEGIPVDGIKDGIILIGVLIAEIGTLVAISKGSTVGSALSIIGVGLAILEIAKVMEQVSAMSWGEILKGLTVVTVAIGELSLIAFALSKMNGLSLTSIGVMLSIGASIVLIAEAMNIIEDLRWDSILKSMVAFGLFIGEFLGITAIIGSSKGGSVEAAATILSIGASLTLIGVAMKIISGISREDIMPATIAVAAIIAALSLVVAASREAKGSMNTLLGVTAAMAALMVGVAALSFLAKDDPLALAYSVAALDALLLGLAAVTGAAKSLGNSKGLLKVFVGIGLILAEIAIIIAILNEQSIDAVRAIGVAGSLSILLVAVSAALVILSYAKEVKKGTMKNAQILTGILAEIAVIVGIMSALKVEGSIKNALSMSILLEAIAGAVYILGHSKKVDNSAITAAESLTKVLAAIAIIVTIMSGLEVEASITNALAMSLLLEAIAGATWILGKVGKVDTSVIPTLRALEEALIVIGVIVTIMGALQIEASLTNAFALSILLEAMAAATLILGNAKSIDSSVLGALGILEAILAGIAIILGIMSALNVEASIPTAIALSILLEALAAAVLIIAHVHADGKSLMLAVAAMALLDAVLLGIAGILILLEKVDVEPSIETALALSVLLVALAAVTALLGVAGLAGAAALVGVLSLITTVAAILGLVVVLGKLNEEKPKLAEFVESGINLLEQLFTGLARVFAAVVAEYLETISAALPGIADNLSSFGEKIGPFVEAVQKVPEEAVEGVKRLAILIGLISAAEFLEHLVAINAKADPIRNFSEHIGNIGRAMADFGRITHGVKIDSGVIDSADTLANVVIKLGVANVLSAIASLAGYDTMTMSKFSTSIVALGEGMAKFGKAIKEGHVNAEQMKTASESAKYLAEMTTYLDGKNFGLFDIFTGTDITIEQFGGMLEAFGDGLARFAQKVENIPDASRAIRVAQTLAQIQSSLGEGFGLVDIFTGRQLNLSDFAENIVAFGTGLNQFAFKVSGISNQTDSALAVAGTLVDLQEKLPINSGFWPWVKGLKEDFSSFGVGVSQLGQGLVDFSNSCDGIDLDSVNETVAVVDELVTMASLLGGEDGSPLLGMYDVGSALIQLGSDISVYYGYIREVSTLQFTRVANSLTELVSVFTTAAGAADNIQAFGASLAGLSLEGIDAFLDSFDNSQEKIETAVVGLLEKYVIAVQNNKDMVVGVFRDLIDEILLELDSYVQDFEKNARANTDAEITGADGNATGVKKSYTGPPSEALDEIDAMDDSFYNASYGNGMSTASGYADTGQDIIDSGSVPVEDLLALLESKDVDFSTIAQHLGISFDEGFEDFDIQDMLDSMGGVEGLTPYINSVIPQASSSAGSLNSAVSNKLSGMGKEEIAQMLLQLGMLPEDIVEQIPDLELAIQKLTAPFGKIDLGGYLDANQLGSNYKGFYSVGQYLAQGFEKGIWDYRYNVYHTVEILGLNTLETLKLYGVDAHSPSRPARFIGQFVSQGFALGIRDDAPMAEDAAEELGLFTIDRLETALNSIGDDYLTLDPVITPVLDLSEIQNGAALMSSMLQEDQYQMNGSMKFAAAAGRSMEGDTVDLTQQAIDKLNMAISKLSGERVTNNNTFNIESNDPEEVAFAVSNILQHQVERTNAQWA